MRYSAVIRDSKTGETRTRDMGECEWKDDLFWWTEGNFACDCNRGMEFIRAVGDEPDSEEDEPTCNVGPNRYVVDRFILADGRVVPFEGKR